MCNNAKAGSRLALGHIAQLSDGGDNEMKEVFNTTAGRTVKRFCANTSRVHVKSPYKVSKSRTASSFSHIKRKKATRSQIMRFKSISYSNLRENNHHNDVPTSVVKTFISFKSKNYISFSLDDLSANTAFKFGNAKVLEEKSSYSGGADNRSLGYI